MNSTKLESIGLILQRFTSNQIEQENQRTDTGTVWAVLAEKIRRNSKANRKLFHTWWNKDRHHIKSNQKEQQKGNPNDGKLMGSAHQRLPTITRPLSVKGAINLQDKRDSVKGNDMLLMLSNLAVITTSDKLMLEMAEIVSMTVRRTMVMQVCDLAVMTKLGPLTSDIVGIVPIIVRRAMMIVMMVRGSDDQVKKTRVR